MPLAHWIRAAVILLLVIIALILVRYDAAGQRFTEADGTSAALVNFSQTAFRR